MPSIFEKPSLLGFRAEGTKRETPTERAGRVLTSPIGSVRPGQLTINPLDQVPTKGFFPWLKDNAIAGAAGFVDYLNEGVLSPLNYMLFGNEPEELRLKERYLKSLGYGVDPSVSEGAAAIAAANDTYEDEAYALPPSASQTPSMFADAAAALAAANETYEAEANALPPAPSMFSAPPAGSRAANIAAAKASGDFGTKVAQYNLEAQRLGHPTQMNEAGEIVPRELSEPEKMREYFKTTGGNTPFLQTTDPAQNALQNEMMKQARGQAAANTFGATPEERRANLEAETNARKILASPLNGGVRDMGNGVRGAFRNGQLIGVAAPGDGSPATMNDPLKRYITNPDGSVSLNPNPPQILMSDEMKDTLGRQGIEGKTGGSPMERGLIAAMAAEEARKKKLAKDAAAAALAAMPPTNEAELIARTPAVTIAPREAAAPKPPPPTRFTPLKDIPGSAVMWDIDPDTGKKLSKPQKMIW